MNSPEDPQRSLFAPKLDDRWKDGAEVGDTNGGEANGGPDWRFFVTQNQTDLLREDVSKEEVEALRREFEKVFRERLEERVGSIEKQKVEFPGRPPDFPSRGDQTKIHKPAGHLTLKLADLVYTEETYERVFEAAILDFRAEHHQALAEGDRLKASIRRVQLVGLVAWLAFRHGVQQLIKPVEPVLNVFR